MQKINPKNNLAFKASSARSAFTIIEVIAAMLIVGLIVGSVMIVIGNCIDSMVDIRLKSGAFELAHQKMEELYSQTSVKEGAESGTSDLNPEIEWETVVEPEETASGDGGVWIKATQTASYKDKNDEKQEIVLVSWVSALSPEQIEQINRNRLARGEEEIGEPEDETDVEEPEEESPEESGPPDGITPEQWEKIQIEITRFESGEISAGELFDILWGILSS